jgi:hypothetical protein
LAIGPREPAKLASDGDDGSLLALAARDQARVALVQALLPLPGDVADFCRHGVVDATAIATGVLLNVQTDELGESLDMNRGPLRDDAKASSRFGAPRRPAACRLRLCAAAGDFRRDVSRDVRKFGPPILFERQGRAYAPESP